jgi:hypothetical protein
LLSLIEQDLKNEIAHGQSLDETASFLCRAGAPDEVAAKAKELGLTFRSKVGAK